MRVQKTVEEPSPKLFVARMALEAHLPAQVTGADLRVSVKRFTEVVAESIPGKDDVTILLPYGDGTAQAIVPVSFLQVPAHL